MDGRRGGEKNLSLNLGANQILTSPTRRRREGGDGRLEPRKPRARYGITLPNTSNCAHREVGKYTLHYFLGM